MMISTAWLAFLNTYKYDEFVKSQKSRHSREGGSP